jgi:hypothetical protein
MFCIGILLGLFDRVFLRPGSGLLLNSIGVVLLPQLLQVESQLAQYIAGFGQQIFVALIAMAPMVDFYRQRRLREGKNFLTSKRDYQQVRPVLSGNRTWAASSPGKGEE